MENSEITTVALGVRSFAIKHKAGDFSRVEAIDVGTAAIIFGVIGAGKAKDQTKDSILEDMRVAIGAKAKNEDGANKYNSQLYVIVNAAGKNAAWNSDFVKSLGSDRAKGMDIPTLLTELETWRGKKGITCVADYLTFLNGGKANANGTEKKTLFEQIDGALSRKGGEMATEELEKLVSRLSALISARKSESATKGMKKEPKTRKAETLQTQIAANA